MKERGGAERWRERKGRNREGERGQKGSSKGKGIRQKLRATV